MSDLLKGGGDSMEEHVIVEQSGSLAFPVGSLVEWQSEPAYYRDIDTTRHVFSKGNYSAIGVDDAVTRYCEKSGVKQVVFRLRDKDKLLRTGIENYLQAKPKKMRGRLQRFVSLVCFQEEPGGQPLPRPEGKVFINEQGEKI